MALQDTTAVLTVIESINSVVKPNKATRVLPCSLSNPESCTTAHPVHQPMAPNLRSGVYFPEFEAAATAAAVGQVVAAKTTRGHHVLVVTEERCAHAM